MRPPVEIPSRTRSSTIDSSSVDHESLIGKRTASINRKSESVDNDESPLSYKSLEERATNAAIALKWERSQSHEQLSSAQYNTLHDSDRRHQLYAKNSATSTESDDIAQKPAVLKEAHKNRKSESETRDSSTKGKVDGRRRSVRCTSNSGF